MVDRVSVLGAITTALKDDPTLSALVAEKIYISDAPSEEHESLMPYVVLASVVSSDANTSEEVTGAIMTIVINVWSTLAAGPAACLAISNAIEGVLNCFDDSGTGILPSTRQINSALLQIDGAWCDRLTYRFLINGA